MVRVNYGQGLTVGAFVGAVALCGSQGPLWAVEGGNQDDAERAPKTQGLQFLSSRFLGGYATLDTKHWTRSYLHWRLLRCLLGS